MGKNSDMSSLQELPGILDDDAEARKFISSSRIIQKALELLTLPDDGVRKLILDIGNLCHLFLCLKRCLDVLGLCDGLIDGAISISAVQGFLWVIVPMLIKEVVVDYPKRSRVSRSRSKKEKEEYLVLTCGQPSGGGEEKQMVEQDNKLKSEAKYEHVSHVEDVKVLRKKCEIQHIVIDRKKEILRNYVRLEMDDAVIAKKDEEIWELEEH
ncbi:hypothetical protein FEM48_Zijuj01G0038900 [Ziziphus jujuba var. spinosa]|uniref:Uncharacterized protein n=1 Tax=Ziziphus jujuba var. spinosa TaxID=714518 RepID=A0A978VZ03_ZIZJJ|nr:hypothetical protein FEM48_Zijuj01G0038900 [Ziziphus jujuba var. spinosa]